MLSSTRANLCNAVLLAAVFQPGLLLTVHLRHSCGQSELHDPAKSALCLLYLERPLVYVNLLFLLNVDVLFWIISIISGSTWVRQACSKACCKVCVNELMEASALQPMLQLIDPAWTLLPPLMAAVYATHPHAVLTAKAAVAYCLLAVWSVRLTHSYFRRHVLRPCFDSLQPSKMVKRHPAGRAASLGLHIAR